MNGTRHEREKGPPAHNIRPFMTDSTRSLICGMTVIAFTRCLFSSLCLEAYAGLGLSRWRQSSTLFSSSSQAERSRGSWTRLAASSPLLHSEAAPPGRGAPPIWEPGEGVA